MPDQVRDIYYKLFISVYDAYKKLSIYPENAFASSESLLSFVQERNTLKELSDALRERSEELLSSMEKDESESETVGADPQLYFYNGVSHSSPAERMFVHKQLNRLGINWFDMRHWYSEGIPAGPLQVPPRPEPARFPR